MRIMKVAIAVLFLLITTMGGEAQALNDKEIAKLIDEYASESSSASRRADIELKLLRVKPAGTTKSMKAALGSDSKRKAALDLAVTLWAPGVFSALKKHTEGDLGPQVVKLGLQRGEKDAVEYLLERWRAAPADSAEFAAIQVGFKTWFIDLPYVEKFKQEVEKQKDEAKKAAAADVMAFQLNTAGRIQDLLDKWETMRERLSKYGKRFALEGRDLTQIIKAWREFDCERCGGNVKVNSTGRSGFVALDVNAIPKEMQSGHWRIVARVCALQDTCKIEVVVGGRDGNNVAGPVFKLENKQWSCPNSGGSSKSVPLKVGAWVTLTWVIKESVENSVRKHHSVLFLDGQQMIAGPTFEGDWAGMGFFVYSGEAVCAGFEAIPE